MSTFFRSILLFSLTAAMCAVVFSQKISADAIAASGSFNGQLYTNKSLGFTMLAPGGWNFYTAEQNKMLVERNRENAAASDDESLKNSAANTQVLFQAVTQNGKSALLSCGVERLTKILTLDKFIAAYKNLVVQRAGVKVKNDINSIKLGGVHFSAFEVEGATTTGTYRQRYIATVRKNAALFFVVTLYDNKQDEIIEYSLKSIKFQ